MISLMYCSGFAILSILMFYLYYRRKMKKEMNNTLHAKINESLSKYYSNDNENSYSGIKS